MFFFCENVISERQHTFKISSVLHNKSCQLGGCGVNEMEIKKDLSFSKPVDERN